MAAPAAPAGDHVMARFLAQQSVTPKVAAINHSVFNEVLEPYISSAMNAADEDDDRVTDAGSVNDSMVNETNMV
eukprot:CAMPEP_0182448674 /NCGR_PEP_ID=MMETSP1172-20130603/28699_1 /TAXON_ID=708627 /ORGANISM="Timspurckia oligopyrenoides, Strain CCMP3278" /LENGTH=73 /DNA_ID=CAMNT_0024645625 /DNA_START=13 /DNA_END=235 /DNA_ORIENTATION=-